MSNAPRSKGPVSVRAPGSVPPASMPRVPALPRGEGTILVTGACGRLGKHVVRIQHRERRVIGVDRRPFPDKPKDVVHEQVDIRRKKLKDLFRAEPIEAVVHLGVMHDPRASQAEHHSWNVAGFQKLLEYVAQFQVPKLVVLSSANVYGPQPDNAQFLTEDAPLLGGARFSEIRDLIEVDMLAQGFFWKHPSTETVILRPVHIVGAVHNAASNFMRLPTIPTLLGFDPMVQVIHESDVVRAIGRALVPGRRGIYNVAGAEPLPLSHVVKILGKPSIPIPYTFGKALLKRLWAFRLTTFPAPELDHIRYVCMVDDRRARDELGYEPAMAIEETEALVLSADHELNPSTFGARVAASAGASLAACVMAALGTASGALHGAATARVEAFVAEVARPERAAAAVRERLARGDSVPGFGHPGYPEGDPRGSRLLEVAQRIGGKSRGVRVLVSIVNAMELVARERPTVDAGLVALAAALGLPRAAPLAIFACGRVAGWIAHALEQRGAGFILRPRARYVGA